MSELAATVAAGMSHTPPGGRSVTDDAPISAPSRRLVELLGEHPDGLTIGQLSEHARARFRGLPREPRLNAIKHRAERVMPPARIYAVRRGHRGDSVV
jgi:hypothetical protein